MNRGGARVSPISSETTWEIDVASISDIFFWQCICVVEMGKLRNFGRLPIDFPVAQGFNQRMGTFLERRWTSALKLALSFREASRRYPRPLSWLFKHIRKLRAVGSGKSRAWHRLLASERDIGGVGNRELARGKVTDRAWTASNVLGYFRSSTNRIDDWRSAKHFQECR